MSDQNYPTAPLYRRLAAMIYDSLIVFALIILAEFVMTGIYVATNGEPPGGNIPASIHYSVMFIICFFYYTHSWLRGGQTIGMKSWRIKLVSEYKPQMRISQCMLRTGVGFFSILVVGLGYWWALFDKRQRSWHDMESMTRIIYMPKGMQEK